MQKIVRTLVMASIVLLVGCSSNNDSDSNNGSDSNTNNGALTTGTLDDVIGRAANSQPVDDGLDQVNADLLTLFGDANVVPVALDDTETVSTFIAKQRSVR